MLVHGNDNDNVYVCGVYKKKRRKKDEEVVSENIYVNYINTWYTYNNTTTHMCAHNVRS